MSSERIIVPVKTLSKICVLTFSLLIFSCVSQKPYTSQSVNNSYQVFYNELSPYGQWVNYPNYNYVWIPNVSSSFSPYSTDGYWIMTKYGWTWVSDYDWGWATFHYGRWDYDNYYGWYWLPDNQWAPAWVNWRSGNGYYGWSPMRPGMSADMNFNGGYDGYDDINRWNFLQYSDLGRHDMDRYFTKRSDNNELFRNTSVINNSFFDKRRNTTYITGPARDEVHRVSGNLFNTVTIRDYERPGESLYKNQFRIYRPRVKLNTEGSRSPSPARTTDLQDVRPLNERNSINQQNNVIPVENNTTQPKQQQQGEQQQQKRRTTRQPQKREQLQQPAQQQQNQNTVNPTMNRREEKPQSVNEKSENEIKRDPVNKNDRRKK